MRYAIIENGMVSNVIVADEANAPETAVQCAPEVGKGWSYDGSAFAPPPAKLPVVTPLDFLQSYISPAHLATWEGLRADAISANPRSDDQANILAAWSVFMAAPKINFASPYVQQQFQALAAWGVLTQAEADQLASGHPVA